MKKLFLLFALVAFSVTVKAQSCQTPVQVTEFADGYHFSHYQTTPAKWTLQVSCATPAGSTQTNIRVEFRKVGGNAVSSTDYTGYTVSGYYFMPQLAYLVGMQAATDYEWRVANTSCEGNPTKAKDNALVWSNWIQFPTPQ